MNKENISQVQRRLAQESKGKPCMERSISTVWRGGRLKHANGSDRPCEQLSYAFRQCAPSLLYFLGEEDTVTWASLPDRGRRVSNDPLLPGSVPSQEKSKI